MTLALSGFQLSARAQTTLGSIEVGGMVGRFSGLSVKAYPHSTEPESRSLDAHMSFNGTGFFSVSSHLLQEKNIVDSPLVAFWGPGASLELNDSALFLGPAAELGVFFALDGYRAFLQIMPQLHMMPKLDGTILASVGIRITL